MKLVKTEFWWMNKKLCVVLALYCMYFYMVIYVYSQVFTGNIREATTQTQNSVPERQSVDPLRIGEPRRPG